MSTRGRAPLLSRAITDHFDGRRFFSPEAPPLPGMFDILRWSLNRRGLEAWPEWIDLEEQPIPLRPKEEGIAATWVGHSTWLLQTPRHTVLIDPVFSERAGPFGRLGPRRVHAPGISLEAMPRVDLILVSHDHYDHCDLASLRFFAERDKPKAYTPLCNGRLLRRAGLEAIELDWWEEHTFGPDLTVTLTPAQHWSNRVSSGRCARLWGGFSVKTPDRHTVFVGDTGYHPKFFHEIRDRLGVPHLAFIPIGAYEPRWFMQGQHVNPEEAVKIHQDLGSQTSLAMHWGTFRLTDEAREAPLRELAKALQVAGVDPNAFQALSPGATFRV